MVQKWKEITTAVILGVFLPWLTVGISSMQFPHETIEITPTEVSTVESTQQDNDSLMILVLVDDIPTKMELTEYLTSVLLCEMPTSFHPEAKKAQAVVARTYALRTVTVKDKHPGQAVCTSPDCCQGYISTEDFVRQGGSKEAVEAARKAVLDTDGLVLTYDGALIDATYFSCSGGYTEDAVAVWGSDIPYLQSVSSPGEEQAAHYTDTVTFTTQEFQNLLGVTISGNQTGWIGKITYTQGGGVDTIRIGGKDFTGIQLRSLLGLRSTAFTVTAIGNSIIITTRGFGHRVGMSQYGADAMAQNGDDFRTILVHYYQGTRLENMGT